MQDKNFAKEDTGKSFRQTYINDKNNYIIVAGSV